MKITVSVTIQADDGTPAVVSDVFTLEREALAPDSLGLHLDEAKDILAAVQEKMVGEQVQVALSEAATCPACEAAHRHKDTRQIVVRTLFGVLRLASPRWWHCSCSTHEAATFSPLAELLPKRTTPELLYLEAKFAGLVSYQTSAKLLAEMLPWAGPCTPPRSVSTPRRWPSGWKTSSARNSSASSTPAKPSGKNYRARICRSSSGWTAGTSTRLPNVPAPTAGSR